MIALNADKKGRELVCNIPTEVPTALIGDEIRLHQVLVNVISNTLQAMPEGGRLTTAAVRNDGSIEIQISDTGCGMTGDTKEKIFDPLFTMKAKGIGLGADRIQVNYRQARGSDRGGERGG